MRFKAEIMYDGTDFHGFQIQPDARTVQGVFEDALKNIFKIKIPVVAAGRTDAKVHALGQVLHFDIDTRMLSWQLKNALNSRLPRDVYVKDLSFAEPGFHARYGAESKDYRYIISLNAFNPLWRDYCWCCKAKLNVNLMQDASLVFLGEHDFTSFSKAGATKNTVRRLDKITFTLKEGILTIDFAGNGFLYHMVRMIVGMLVEVGKGKITKEALKDILEMKKRGVVKKIAPPNGLYLVKIHYAD